MVDVLLTELAEVSRAVSQTSARLAKVAALADALRSAARGRGPGCRGLPVRGAAAAADRGRVGGAAVGAASRRDVVADPARGGRGVLADRGRRRARGRRRSGSGSSGSLFAAATAEEQFFLVRLLSGELRQGALDGVMTDAVAQGGRGAGGRGAAGGHAQRVAGGGRAGRARRRQRRACPVRAAGRPAAQADAGQPARRRSPTPSPG